MMKKGMYFFFCNMVIFLFLFFVYERYILYILIDLYILFYDILLNDKREEYL